MKGRAGSLQIQEKYPKMSFKDIFKNSFVSSFNTAQLDISAIVFGMAVVCVLALYIFFAHRILTRKTFYNKNFGIALAALAIITAAIILTIQSSIVISLGMVGALSIVRFRTAIKDPMDLVFLFWSISVGIICGAGLYPLAIVVSVVVTAAIFVLDMVPVTKAPMLLIVNMADADSEDALLDIVKKYSKFYKIKSHNISHGRTDMVIEVRVTEGRALVKEVGGLKGMDSVSLLSHDGETTY